MVERQEPDGGTAGIFEKVIQPTLATGECDEDDHTLCLQDGRFRVTVTWQDAQLQGGSGRALPLTGDTGTFWFFDQDNLEVVMKILNGCGTSGHFWVFGAGLTDVEVNLVVDDVVSGKSRSYFKPLGVEFSPIVDTSAFDTCDEESASTVPSAATVPLARRAWNDLVEELAAAAPSRVNPLAASTPLLLGGGRFRVEVEWSTAGGQSGVGEGVPLGGDSGYFWFFGPSNVEMLLKVVAGCSVNGHHWVFAGGLTDVAVRVQVTDTTSGATRLYESPSGQPFRPVRDVEAFGCP